MLIPQFNHSVSLGKMFLKHLFNSNPDCYIYAFGKCGIKMCLKGSVTSKPKIAPGMRGYFSSCGSRCVRKLPGPFWKAFEWTE